MFNRAYRNELNHSRNAGNRLHTKGKTMGHADNEELRDGLIADLAEKQLLARRNALLAGDKKTMSEVCNSVLDYLSGASDLPQLVIQSLTSARAVTGKSFGDVVAKVMADEAECDAIRQVEQLEREAKENSDNFKPKTRAVAAFITASPP